MWPLCVPGMPQVWPWCGPDAATGAAQVWPRNVGRLATSAAGTVKFKHNPNPTLDALPYKISILTNKISLAQISFKLVCTLIPGPPGTQKALHGSAYYPSFWYLTHH